MSSTFSPAEILRRHRPLLLAMEAIGWFHMAGKSRVEFLRRHGGENNGYNERQWHQQETQPSAWDDLQWVRQLYGAGIPNDAWPESFAKFIETHIDRNTGMLGLLQAGHAMASGIEKQSYPDKTISYLNQSIPHMWLSSPWGHPKRNLLANPPEILTPQGWRQLVGEIRRVLEELRDLGTRQVQDVALWQSWRERAIGEESFIRRAFLSTLAETRLPNNDVTLWDQSYVAAALFKSAVAGVLLNPSPRFTDQDIENYLQQVVANWNQLGRKKRQQIINSYVKNNTRWRLLTIAIGTEHYEARSVKIGDWTGAQGAIEEFFSQVAELVEADLAVGSLLYRDDSVAVFSFPGERSDETVPAAWLNGWEEWLQEQVDEIARDLDLETPPHVCLSSPTRSLVPMVREWRAAKSKVAVPIHRSWDVRWLAPSESRGHVCPVCGVRLNGDPTDKGKPCSVCRQRRHHRRDAWLQGHLGYDTIWFEEVADRNGRLALLTFSLDLGAWLNGEHVDSLRAQAIPEWVKFNPILDGTPNPIDSHAPYESLRNYIRGKLSSPKGDDPVLKNLQEGYQNEPDWPTFFKKIVEDRADAPAWDTLSDDQRASWLAHQLLRKLPSPGRVYRFWREAEDFFREILRDFRELAASSENPWRRLRIFLVPENIFLVPENENNHHQLKDRQVYNGDLRGAPFSLLYLRSAGGFITISNLARVLRPEETANRLKEIINNDSAEFKEEDGKTVFRLKIKEAKAGRDLPPALGHLGSYHPIIPLEISPLRFRVVVPLEVASACVDRAIRAWENQFARVWDRLPLRIGVVAFPLMLPYQAVAEAARNLEGALTTAEEYWCVQTIKKRNGMLSLHLRHGEYEEIRLVPGKLPDGREDVFYPYAAVRNGKLRFPRDFRHPNGTIYRHMADLRAGDELRVFPARIATLFMDSTAMRFSIPQPRYLQEWQKMREIWQLVRETAPSQTALQRLRNELARLERDWKGPDGQPAAGKELWKDTLRALLAKHLEAKDAVLETLTEAACKGLLQWALEWHMTAIKARIQGGTR